MRRVWSEQASKRWGRSCLAHGPHRTIEQRPTKQLGATTQLFGTPVVGFALQQLRQLLMPLASCLLTTCAILLGSTRRLGGATTQVAQGWAPS